MEIKRKFEMLIETNRRYIIRQSPPGGQFICAKCGEPMLMVEQAAGLFDITQRRVFRIIEVKTVHFTEIETGAVMICITSLKTALGGGEILTPTDSSQ
ncbi:MAG TPA: hypothetical protein VF556_08760 [Pyrinomonadaceae bacterium]|jgi:hypothetical protein